MPSLISSPDVGAIVTPILSALPPAALSTQPSPTILPLLSPILRQRVQLLSAGGNDPWIRLLTYDVAKVPKLTEIAQNGTIEPHPVSGEVEVDWDYDAQIRYRRLDEETIQTLVVLAPFDLFFRLIYCINDKDGGGDGWRVGEVGVASHPSTLDAFGGHDSVAAAETAFVAATGPKGGKNPNGLQISVNGTNGVSHAPVINGHREEAEGDEADDDDYWARYDATPARYDATPARTPAQQRSPAPQSVRGGRQPTPRNVSHGAEDDYYAQYDTVQPAMDPHDPDEEVESLEPPPPLGLQRPEVDQNGLNETSGVWTLADPPSESPTLQLNGDRLAAADLVHPRPESPASSNGSMTVAKLEETAGKNEQTEFGVKQHISRSIRSLFLLSRTAGIDRDEFERMVRTELDVLSMVEDDM